MKNILLETFVIHIIFFGSIFVTYFRSPVIQNLSPENDLDNPPANRLVLFVSDGLRAESFFRHECADVPYLKKIITKTGTTGISHTRVPTESRPGHIALIAGLYEDPTAVTKGWKENPVDFDSAFNRSRKTYAWGSHDVISVFSKKKNEKFYISSYEHAVDFSGKEKTFELDIWVFERVKNYLHANKNILKNDTKIIFFLHLLGLDTAGHVHKPGSYLFIENLKVTDRGIYEIYQLFEDIFKDNKTAYIVTSDHGMTNSGSHGAGDTFETETPFIAWGAGVNDWTKQNIDGKKSNGFFTVGNVDVPRFDIEQGDAAPLISNLIGVAIPVNNYGKLPRTYLNVSMDYMAKATLNNAFQMLNQYTYLLNEFKKGYFSDYLPIYTTLTSEKINLIKQNIKTLLLQNRLEQLIESMEILTQDALEGIEYFQKYFETFLLCCTTLSFIAWSAYLLQLFYNEKEKHPLYIWKTKIRGLSIAILSAALIYLQNISLLIGFYILLPIICWIRTLQRSLSVTTKITVGQLKYIALLIIGIELMVLSFYERKTISAILLGLVFFEIFFTKRYTDIMGSKELFFKWVISSLVLLIFPFLPDVRGYKNDYWVLIGILTEFLKCQTINIRYTKYIYMFYTIGFLNLLVSLYFFHNSLGVYVINIGISWLLTGAALILPICTTKPGGLDRLRHIFCFLSIPYIHLSVGYEPIFYNVYCIFLSTWIDLKDQKRDYLTLTKLTTQDDGIYFQTSFSTLLMIFFSFFGTGNIASVSSFDPNSSRFFVTTFSPFVMSFLIIFKLMIPIIVLGCTIWRLMYIEKMDGRKLFISMLLICELMALNFLFAVTNKGSWLEIGYSISRFVIMESVILVLVLINWLSDKLMNLKL